jgi:ketosteroid isomerase-like protein
MLGLTLAAAMAVGSAHPAPSAATRGLARFNHAFTDAVRRMDNAAVLALWENDGISLLPQTPPIVGKAKIAKMLEEATAGHPQAHMQSFTNDCFDEKISGAWASEWCVEHQVVVGLGDKPFDGWGKMLLVLHRGRAGWRLSCEMWNQAVPANSAH